MKLLSVFIVTVTLLFSGSLVNAKTNNPVKGLNKQLVELNLVEGINSDNEGLKVSAAYLAGELKSSMSVIPLLKMFNTESNEKVRIAAALSLLKIGDPRGLKAIKFAYQHDSSQYVRDLCKGFYCCYILNLPK